jgi:hypothetical protein
MHNLLTGIAVLVALAGPAVAQQQPRTTEVPEREYSTHAPTAAEAYRVRLDRSIFDQVGPGVDISQLCGPSGARQVENRRSATDILLTFVSVGFYTPTHVRVVCNTPRTAVMR